MIFTTLCERGSKMRSLDKKINDDDDDNNNKLLIITKKIFIAVGVCDLQQRNNFDDAENNILVKADK